MNEFEKAPGELCEDLTEGLHSVLYRVISAVNINDGRLQEAFRRFVDNVEVGDAFTVGDVIFSAEKVLKQYSPKANAGDDIFVFDRVAGNGKLFRKLLKYSFGGLYDLIGCRNGVLLDIDTIGGAVSAAEAKRFAVLKPSKGASLALQAQSAGINMIKAGNILAKNDVMICRGNETLDEFHKPEFYSEEAKNEVCLDGSDFESYANAYRAVCAYSSCNTVNDNNLMRFGLSGTLSEVFARALGFFSAMLYTKLMPARLVFANDALCSVAVPRPEIADGDYLYLLKVNCDADGIPERAHHGQLNFYLAEMKKRGVIKDVLPLKENIENVIARLCGKEYEYASLTEIPQQCFGVIVSVPRGLSVNGIKLGCFKTIV